MSDVGQRPPKTFSPQDLERIIDAIVDGYDYKTLARELFFKWGMRLDDHVNTNQGKIGIFFELIDWTERRGKTLELLALAYAENPENQLLKTTAEAYGLPLGAVTQKYDLSQPTPPKPSLEAAITKHSRFVDYGRFLTRFINLGERVCRVEHPDQLGTGFLVGPDLVLTNFHVVESGNGSGRTIDSAKITRTVCRFDYQGDCAGKIVRLTADPVLASRPYSRSDLTGEGEPDATELDYALLRLAEPAGSTAGSGGGKRGWFPLDADPLLAVRDFVVIPQHPDGRHLEVAWGTALAFNAEATRVRHDTITDGGSSGSPCFTMDLEAFGLHHARDPQTNPTFNQAIPLTLIAADLATQGVTLSG